MSTNRSGAPGARGALRSMLPTKLDQATDATIALGLGVLLAVGFAASYTTLLELAVDVGEYPTWLAWAVPLAFDLGIVVLSLKVVRAAREGRTAPILRLLVVALAITTVAANAASASTPAGALLHAVPPAMFVISFESVIASTRRHALERLGLIPPQLPRVRGVRWLLAPWSTFRAWRAAVLERSLFERAEQPAERAPEPRRSAPVKRAVVQAPAPPAPQPLRAVPPPESTTTPAGRQRHSLDTLLAKAAELLGPGDEITQRSVQTALRGARYSVGSERALEIANTLTATRARKEA